MNERAHRLVGTSPRLAVEAEGSGVTVLFLHGIGGNRRNWDGQMRGLARDHRVVAFDFRGYGDSEDASGAIDFHDFTEDVGRVVDALALTPCHLVGLSMGGLVAQAFYARRPRDVLSLTLAGCRPGSAPVFEQQQSFADERLRPLASGSSEDLADALLPRLLGPAVAPEARDVIRDSLVRLRPPSYRKVVAARGVIAPFLDLADIAVPTLVIGATHDRVAPLVQMQEIADAIPGSRFATIEGAGHLMNIEQNEPFNAILRDFLTAQMDQTLQNSRTQQPERGPDTGDLR